MEEGILIRREGKKTLRKSDTGWPKVEKALGDRKYTVFAGHIHHYAKYIRNNRNGIWKYFDKQGNLEEEIVYQGGKIVDSE